MMTGPQTPDGSRPVAENELGALLARVALWDRGAFARLYQSTCARLYGVISPIVPGTDARCDALGETYVRIWERAGDYDPAASSPTVWMAAIAHSRALDEVRRVRPLALLLSGAPETPEPAAREIDPLRARPTSREARAFLEAFRELDDAKRRLLARAYCHGESGEALARRFGDPPATVRFRLRRVLAQLRDRLGS